MFLLEPVPTQKVGGGWGVIKSLYAPHLAENCFMHQSQEKVSLNDRLDKACEPGVDYGEYGGR